MRTADALANDPLLHPICAGTGLRCPDVCPRCGATDNDECRDQAAQDYQLDAIANGTCEVIRIETPEVAQERDWTDARKFE